MTLQDAVMCGITVVHVVRPWIEVPTGDENVLPAPARGKTLGSCGPDHWGAASMERTLFSRNKRNNARTYKKVRVYRERYSFRSA